MRKLILGAMLAGLLAMTAACSVQTRMALEEERQNGAHFATWDHMGYSLKRATPEATTKRDVEVSKADQCLPNQKCSWWGEAVMVQPMQ